MKTCGRTACGRDAKSGKHRDLRTTYCIPCARRINEAAGTVLVPLRPDPADSARNEPFNISTEGIR